MKQVLVQPKGDGGVGTVMPFDRCPDTLSGGVVALTAVSVAQGASDVVTNWMDVAACRDTDPDLFFPVGSTGPAVDQIEAAKHVCDTCPAKRPCLEFALVSNQDSGVWGGTSEDERRKLRRAWVKNRRAAS